MGIVARKSHKNRHKYWSLIRLFPLCPIKNAEQHKQGIEILQDLAQKKSHSDDEIDYIAVLGKLLAEYEQSKPSIQQFFEEASRGTPVEVLKFLMDENQLTQTQIALETGLDQGNISAFLSGRRKLSSVAALKLAKRFAVPADLFLAS